MSDTKNYLGQDAVEKLRDLATSASTCMLASGLEEIPPHVCPMQVQQVDEQGRLWFFSGADSVHNQQLTTDPRAHLTFANPAKNEFLTVFGEVVISKDRQKIDELWSKMIECWFPDGKDDPNLTLLRVTPELAHYWDTKDGKLISCAKILTGAVLGTTMDGRVHGDLEI